jgi:hypothetical protein
MADNWSVLAAHCIATLPPDIDQRYQLVKALSESAPPEALLADYVKCLRFGLDHHFTQIMEFSLQNGGSK